ncbi:hypothetical protein LR48_Vigan02g215300 [Vigna angularis]|uniref:Uncharacterized protein n=1 Tax=Phaseolus angularis TaxID=3914 RepID=A0A0L9TZJ6_PHAAN|nr:hypothetical protein LR48_Vigan02g215300 [Vigna angularis]
MAQERLSFYRGVVDVEAATPLQQRRLRARFGLLSTVGAGEDEPFHYQLGRKVFVDLTERKFEQNCSGKRIEKWTMSYNVDRSNCRFTLTISDEDAGAKVLLLQLLSVIPAGSREFSEYKFDLDVQTVTESDALANPISIIDGRGPQTINIEYGKQIHGGSVTHTSVFIVNIQASLTRGLRKRTETRIQEKKKTNPKDCHVIDTSLPLL